MVPLDSELLKKQKRFTKLVGELIAWAYQQDGYELTFGEALRLRWVAEVYHNQGKGSLNSLHVKSLAIDLNLFVNGVYRKDSEAYKPLGDYWKSLDPDARWGGDFKRWDEREGKFIPKPDGNHFSLEFEGVK